LHKNILINLCWFHVDDLCTNKILTSELIDGIPVDKCENLDKKTKEHICKLIMILCLKELFVFRYMQTDPNWSNFFYNPATKQVCNNSKKKIIILDCIKKKKLYI
jgi:predicted unusual protein kinase regulating ubiquinone biosynthesis (AarF/ABC1/UbiB family)